MLKIVKRSSNNKYTGNVVVTQDEVNEIEEVFKSKFDAFCYGIDHSWSKACIMRYCLDTTRDQYFYNYYLKYLGTL